MVILNAALAVLSDKGLYVCVCVCVCGGGGGPPLDKTIYLSTKKFPFSGHFHAKSGILR